VGCGEPVNLADYDYNIACGAKILRFCRDKYPQWDLAVRCYQGMAVPEMTKDYLLKVQREIGRLTLARLDEQTRIAAAKAKARAAAKAASRPKRPVRKPAPPIVLPTPMDTIQIIAHAGALEN
jgi:hypothetical protein